MVKRRSYGYCPAQLDGFTADGRPFYFRSRGAWSLRVGEVGWVANICGWPGQGTTVAYGDYELEDPDRIDEVIEKYLGAGWRVAEYFEQMFPQKCSRCDKTFRSDGSNICTNCLAKALGF